MVLWASVVAALGWIYAALASLWPALFARHAIKHGVRGEAGYRIGWVVYWRLPTRVTILVTLLSALPLLAVVFLRGWLVAVPLTIVTGIILFLWMIAPPGTRLGYVAKGREGGEITFELRRSRDVSRAILLFVILGLIPAFAIGAILSWILARFAI